MAKTFTSLTDPELISMINSGAVGIIPTDTVYGLVAKADMPQALENFFQAKPRHHEPGTIIGASVKQFAKLGFHLETLRTAAEYWPNAISIVLNASDVGGSLKQSRTTLPLRIPDMPDLIALLRATGPLMTTSANQHGQPTSTTIEQAIACFQDSADFYVDYGLIEHPPSTIIEVTPDHNILVHRAGSVDIT